MHDRSLSLPDGLEQVISASAALYPRPLLMIWFVVILVSSLLGGFLLLRWGERWGSTPEERTREFPGDAYLVDGPTVRVTMTRAISIRASPEQVWPWIAQLGRGSGWYSIDRLDNGRRISARHIVSWIPDPRLGDASAIGYLRHVEAGRALAWWVDGVRFVGARARLVTCFALEPEGDGTRLVSRMSADASGLTAHIALLVFRTVDTIMARRQLLGIRDRVEARPEKGGDPETGARDQYQLYEVLYAGGGNAGVAGVEDAARWRQLATQDGVLRRDES